MDPNLLNALNNPENANFEIIRTKELVKGKKYRVYDFFVMTTKYGNKVVATLEDNKKYFLPPSYAVKIKKWEKTPEDINCTGLYMILEGYKKNKFKSPVLKFVQDEPEGSEDDDDEESEEVE